MENPQENINMEENVQENVNTEVKMDEPNDINVKTEENNHEQTTQIEEIKTEEPITEKDVEKSQEKTDPGSSKSKKCNKLHSFLGNFGKYVFDFISFWTFVW